MARALVRRVVPSSPSPLLHDCVATVPVCGPCLQKFPAKVTATCFRPTAALFARTPTSFGFPLHTVVCSRTDPVLSLPRLLLHPSLPVRFLIHRSCRITCRLTQWLAHPALRLTAFPALRSQHLMFSAPTSAPYSLLVSSRALAMLPLPLRDWATSLVASLWPRSRHIARFSHDCFPCCAIVTPAAFASATSTTCWITPRSW